MSFVLKNLEKTFRKLDTIISVVSKTNECNQIDISLEEVIADLDIAIANIRDIYKNENFTTTNK